jgi:aspartyl/asparaginyl beta-hydroxylase (cupin superfamily)
MTQMPAGRSPLPIPQPGFRGALRHALRKLTATSSPNNAGLRLLNAFFDIATGGKRRPALFDIARTCPALLELDRNYPLIRRELAGILSDKGAIPRYHELDQMQRRISTAGDPDKDWKVFYLYAMGEKPENNRARCPETSALLDRVPGLFQAFFSILDGGKSIPAHCGPYRGYLRYHLGLIVPPKDPPTIRIKDQYHTWQEGKSILFDDSWEHEVFNKSADDRVILIVDVRRPMPLPFAAVNRLMEWVVRLVYGKKILKKLI